jgi:hypothetical protein
LACKEGGISNNKGGIKMGILKHLVAKYAKRKLKEIEYVLNHQIELSEQKLNEILKRHETTVIGRKYDFGSIRNEEEYRSRVPLMDSQSIQPYLEMIYENPNGAVLTSDPVIWYLQSSGTTGKPKRLPITKRGVKDLAKGSSLSWMAFMNAQPENPQVIEGTMVTFGAPAIFDEINGIPVGYGTGVLTQMQNKLFQKLITPGVDVFNIIDIEEKMRAYALHCASNNVTGLGGITTLCLALVRRMQEQYGPWLFEVLRGTKHGSRINAAMDSEGHLDVSQLWPELRLFFTAGINTDPYRSWITKTFPKVTIWESWGGSEGFYGGQLLPSPGVQLATFVNYFEFIPEHEVHKPQANTISLSDIKKGNRYEVIITNIGGYYRYRIGDMVTFTDTDPYTVRFIGRKGKVVNLSGEKLSDAHVDNALADACRRTGIELVDCTVVGHIEEGLPHYTIAALFRDTYVDVIEFIGAFEDSLMKSNNEFKIVREVGALGATTLMRMNKSLFEDAVKASPMQAKPISLTTDISVLTDCEAIV